MQLPQTISPAAIFLTGEESIRLSCLNGATGVTLALSGRFLPVRDEDADPPDAVGNFLHAITPATNRTLSTRTQPLGKGWLLDWSVVATAGSPQIGQCWAAVQLVRGQTGNLQEFTTLGQGYVTANNRIGSAQPSWLSSLEGGGALRSIAGTNPGAGVEVSETVPAGVRWQLLGLTVTLVTSATVANRAVTFNVDDGTTVYHASTVQTVQTASQTILNTFSPAGFSGANGGNRYQAGAPDPLFLAAGHRIRTVTLNVDAGDDYGAPQYLVREWIEVN